MESLLFPFAVFRRHRLINRLEIQQYRYYASGSFGPYEIAKAHALFLILGDDRQKYLSLCGPVYSGLRGMKNS